MRSLKKWPGTGPVGMSVVWIRGPGTPAWRRAWRLAAQRSSSQRPGADGSGRMNSGRGRAEGPGYGLVDVGTDLVAVRPDGGADPGDDVGRAGAQALHGGQGRGGHPGHGAAPARVHAGEHAGHRVVQHDRHAVRGQDREHHPGRGGDQRVGPGPPTGPAGLADTADGVVEREGAAPPVGVGHDADPGAVHLAGEDEIAGVRAEGGRQPAPVLQHAARVVAHAQAQVQRRVGPGRHPARARGDGGVGAGRVQGGPGQQAQVAGRAERGGRGRGGIGGHRV